MRMNVKGKNEKDETTLSHPFFMRVSLVDQPCVSQLFDKFLRISAGALFVQTVIFIYERCDHGVDIGAVR